MRTTLVSLILIATSTACYQYVPVDEAAPLPETGGEVRLRLNSPQSLEMGSMTMHDITILEGNVHESNGETMSLFSSKVRSAYGHTEHTNGAVFYIDRSDIDRVEQRELIPWKTGVAVGVGVAAIALTAVVLFDLGGGNEGTNTPPPPQARRGFILPLNLVFP